MREKVDEREAIAEYQVTPFDTKWIDMNEAFEGGAHANQVTNWCKRIQKWRSARSVRGDPSMAAFDAIISVAANQKHIFSITHIDVSVTRKPRDLCWYAYQCRTDWAPTLRKLVF